MKTALQKFVVAVFVLTGVVLIALWSVSLYVTFGDPTTGNQNADFAALWLRQVAWFAPLLIAALLLLYYAVFKAMIWPLLKLSRKMHHVIEARNLRNRGQSADLGPGLELLDRNFRHLTDLATHDPLTGLNSRILFEERLKQAIVEGKRNARKYALVCVDIDNFHRVNDEYGHYIADGVLKQLANRLSKGLRESDSVARLEKDDFAVLLEFSNQEQISNLLGKIHRYLTRSYRVYGRRVTITLSMGVAVYPDHAQDADELALIADRALIEAQKGDQPLVFAGSKDDSADYSGYSMVQALRHALENEEFKLVFQPVLEIKSNLTSYFEALLRWSQPADHDYSIARMIDMAEKNQLIQPLSNWIIDHACKALSTLNHPSVRIAVNLSMVDLHDEQLPERVRASLERWNIAAHELQIEITESQIMQEPEQVIAILNRLAGMGIGLSIDDFGTGQASLTYLRRLPVKKIKIDQSFVKDMVANADDRTIVEATIHLAHTLGIEVTAEGVESAATLDMLTAMDCDYVQGYYISRPIDQDQIPRWCSDQAARNAS